MAALSGLSQVEQSPRYLAGRACDIEINRLRLPIGKQDQYASAFGGVNAITFEEEVSVRPVQLPQFKQELQRRLLLFSTGRTRQSSSILSQQREDIGRRADVTESMHRMKDIARI